MKAEETFIKKCDKEIKKYNEEYVRLNEEYHNINFKEKRKFIKNRLKEIGIIISYYTNKKNQMIELIFKRQESVVSGKLMSEIMNRR